MIELGEGRKMKRSSRMAMIAGAAALVVGGYNAIGLGAIVIDGTLDAGYGSVLAVQTNASNFGIGSDGTTHLNPSANGGTGDQPQQGQLANAYGYIDTANNKLDIFLGGAINLGDEWFNLAIDADPTTGVATLAPGVHSGVNDTGDVPSSASSAGNLFKASTTFDSGFRPESLFRFQFNGGYIPFYDNLLTGNEVAYPGFATPDPRGHVVTRGDPANGGLAGDPAGSPVFTYTESTANKGAVITSGFASVNQGFEAQFDLTSLGWVPELRSTFPPFSPSNLTPPPITKFWAPTPPGLTPTTISISTSPITHWLPVTSSLPFRFPNRPAWRWLLRRDRPAGPPTRS